VGAKTRRLQGPSNKNTNLLGFLKTFWGRRCNIPNK